MSTNNLSDSIEAARIKAAEADFKRRSEQEQSEEIIKNIVIWQGDHSDRFLQGDILVARGGRFIIAHAWYYDHKTDKTYFDGYYDN